MVKANKLLQCAAPLEHWETLVCLMQRRDEAGSGPMMATIVWGSQLTWLRLCSGEWQHALAVAASARVSGVAAAQLDLYSRTRSSVQWEPVLDSTNRVLSSSMCSGTRKVVSYTWIQ